MIIIVNICAVLTILLLYFVSHSIAATFFSCVIFAVGHLYCETIKNETKNRAHFLMNCIFIFYLIIALLHYGDTMLNLLAYSYDKHLMKVPDQLWFYQVAKEFSGNHDFSIIIHRCFVNPEYSDLNGYLFYISVIAYIADVFF